MFTSRGDRKGCSGYNPPVLTALYNSWWWRPVSLITRVICPLTEWWSDDGKHVLHQIGVSLCEWSYGTWFDKTDYVTYKFRFNCRNHLEYEWIHLSELFKIGFIQFSFIQIKMSPLFHIDFTKSTASVMKHCLWEENNEQDIANELKLVLKNSSLQK